MKKLLYNASRSEIFNLDNLTSIKRIEDESGNKGIILKFSSEDYFLITPGEHLPLMVYFVNGIGTCIPDFHQKVYRCVQNGNYEENKKLYEYFEHKFTKSSLCQKSVNKSN